jgi:putative alpha-1,2-mannosidase
MDKNQYVDVFLGSGPIDLPRPEGVAAQWRFIKGLAGNTTPAAARPFGKITACAYSGGYSAGYGCIGVNCGEPLRQIMPEGTIRGFSHLHHSGTGFIDTFYNYAVTAPTFSDEPEAAFSPEIMAHEQARPGYYAAQMRGVLCELTVSAQAAYHRYTFPRDGGKLVIDFTNDGLLEEKTRMPCERLQVTVVRPDVVECTAVLHSLALNFCVRCPGANARVWEKGCVLDGLRAGEVRMALGISPKSMDIARQGALVCDRSFDDVAHEAAGKWNEALLAIDIEADSERDARLFYSNFYHTLIKPSDWTGESFLYDDEEACMLDFATLWDQYKTQMPLLFTLYPRVSDNIVRTILAYCRAKGRMPHMLMLERNKEHEEDEKQARMLAEHVLTDAYYRGVEMDLGEVARCIRIDLMDPARFADYKATGVCENIAQTIDMADGCHASAQLARAAGDEALAAACAALARKWTAAFDRNTGLLNANSWFYEGNHWNYSFRLMHDMPTRLEIAGGKAAYAKLLDRFFGFSLEEGEAAYFEGFNNETDMETPYAYHYADRHDRVCEVVRAGLDYMFCEGRGGIPGNNDSGGLSSLYLWNMMGIFPVSGQNIMLIGSPRLKSARLRLANGKAFVIRREGDGIYVRQAILQGKALERFEFRVDQMMRGGELTLIMSDKPVRKPMC